MFNKSKEIPIKIIHKCKTKIILSFIISICVLLSIFNTLSLNSGALSEPIKVMIDGEKISFDVNPELVNNRVMVPMRKIFEYFGAKVKWYKSSRSIEAVCNDCLYIDMQINNNEMHINTKR